MSSESKGDPDRGVHSEGDHSTGDHTSDGHDTQGQGSGKGKAGGAIGNSNSIRHGNYSRRYGVVLARIGRKYAGVYHDLCRFRRSLENLVMEIRGKVTLSDTAKIQSACRHEASCRLVEKMLYENPDLKPAEIIKHRESLGRWTAQRDKAIFDILGKDADTADSVSSLYDDPDDEPEATESDQDEQDASDDESHPGRADNARADGSGDPAGDDGDESGEDSGDEQDSDDSDFLDEL